MVSPLSGTWTYTGEPILFFFIREILNIREIRGQKKHLPA
jgi:hypothetical protein